MKACLLLFVIGLAVVAAQTPNGFSPKKYTLNLDLDPVDRWTDIITDYYNYDVELSFTELNAAVPSYVTSIAKLIAPYAYKAMGEYGEEMAGIAAAFKKVAPNGVVNEGNLLVLNLIYSLRAGCTSVVGQTSDDVMIHGRNMDFGMTVALRYLSIEVDYQKGGQTVYHATTFAGYTGTPTGMRPGAFSISINARHVGDSLVKNLWDIVKGNSPVAWAVRSTLENVDNYKDAVAHISNSKLSSSMYFIIAGINPGEGAVITMNHESVADNWPVDVDSGRWFVLETNYDHWQPPPSYDDRRDPGNKYMNTMGRDKLSVDTFKEELFMKTPIMRPWTVYTAIMCAKTGHYETTLWSYY